MSPAASQEVAIVAIIQPAEGKLERLREVMREAIDWITANEPDTLEFSLYEDHTNTSPSADGNDGVRLFMVERYASQAALTAHEGSEHYAAFFKSMAEEQLLAFPPMVAKGASSYALRR